MRIVKIVLVCLLLTALILPVAPVGASSGEFQIQWAVHMPRQTYFIGEMVNFTATATTSSSPFLKIPNEYANVRIVNQTGADIFDWQAMTDSNGTAYFYWNSSVDQQPGNYSVILTDSYGNIVSGNFTLLFNQDTYNQGRLDQLQREIDARDQYLNILFSRDFWLVNQVQALNQMAYVDFGVVFLTFLLILSMWFSNRAQKANLPENRDKTWAKGFKMLGFSSTPPSRLTDKQPLVAAYVSPQELRPPRIGMTEFCDKCDPEHKKPMTKARLEQHKLMHEKLYLGIDGWRRKRAAKRIMRAAYPRPKKEYIFEQDKKEPKARGELIHKTAEIVKKLKAKEDATTEVIELREQAKAYSEILVKPRPAYKQTAPAKVRKQRKLREEVSVSTSQEARPASQKIPVAKTDIDELWEHLKNEEMS